MAGFGGKPAAWRCPAAGVGGCPAAWVCPTAVVVGSPAAWGCPEAGVDGCPAAWVCPAAEVGGCPAAWVCPEVGLGGCPAAGLLNPACWRGGCPTTVGGRRAAQTGGSGARAVNETCSSPLQVSSSSLAHVPLALHCLKLESSEENRLWSTIFAPKSHITYCVSV